MKWNEIESMGIVFRSSAHPLWARSTRNPDVGTGPLARPFTRLLAPLICLLAHFAHSRARGKVIDSMAIYSVFVSVLAHCALYRSHAVVVSCWRVMSSISTISGAWVNSSEISIPALTFSITESRMKRRGRLPLFLSLFG